MDKLKFKKLTKPSEWNKWSFCLSNEFCSDREETKQIFLGEIDIAQGADGNWVVTRIATGEPVANNQGETI